MPSPYQTEAATLPSDVWIRAARAGAVRPPLSSVALAHPHKLLPRIVARSATFGVRGHSELLVGCRGPDRPRTISDCRAENVSGISQGGLHNA